MSGVAPYQPGREARSGNGRQARSGNGSRTPGAGGEPARSYQAMGSSVDPGDLAPVHRRREAITELGSVLRRLVEQASATEAPADQLDQVAAALREAAELLGPHTRRRHELPSADDLLGGIRIYNPVCGSGSGIAPPLHLEGADGTAVGTCTLGLAFEGPPAYAHGGVSALLMDQMLGYAVSTSGHPGMTVELTNRYRAPVPLQTPLRLSARVVGIQGRVITAVASIATAAAPETPLVEATGVFVELSGEQIERLFHRVLDSPDESDHPDRSRESD